MLFGETNRLVRGGVNDSEVTGGRE